jgi:hypothetical protein
LPVVPSEFETQLTSGMHKTKHQYKIPYQKPGIIETDYALPSSQYVKKNLGNCHGVYTLQNITSGGQGLGYFMAFLIANVH